MCGNEVEGQKLDELVQREDLRTDKNLKLEETYRKKNSPAIPPSDLYS
jgi:hypothetical protein